MLNKTFLNFLVQGYDFFFSVKTTDPQTKITLNTTHIKNS